RAAARGILIVPNRGPSAGNLRIPRLRLGMTRPGDHTLFLIAPVLATQLASVKPPKHKSSLPDSTDMTLVEVQNNRNVPVTVYGQNSWGELKLGVVPAETT